MHTLHLHQMDTQHTLEKNEDVIKVPISHFMKLMDACCTLHNCLENVNNCDCLNSIKEEDEKRKN